MADNKKTQEVFTFTDGEMLSGPMAERLYNLERAVIEAYNSKEEAKVQAVYAALLIFRERLGKISSLYDSTFDKREMFGADTFPNIVRIRKHSDTVGRPRKAKEVKALTF